MWDPLCDVGSLDPTELSCPVIFIFHYMEKMKHGKDWGITYIIFLTFETDDMTNGNKNAF